MASDNCSVKVAVRIRPPSSKELARQEKMCVSIVPGHPQVIVGDKSFTFDYAFEEETKTSVIYDECVKNLVDGIFDGYNATVLAYGQTGSGKTFTMGTSFDSHSSFSASQKGIGIIPQAAQHLFNSIVERKAMAAESGHLEPTFEVSVQFIELYNEDIFDLLGDQRNPVAIRIKENQDKNEINVDGTVRAPVRSVEELMQTLGKGAANRTTIATKMNESSSRSHAIFSVFVKQKREVEDSEILMDDTDCSFTEMEVLNTKFHFVDLAGSERMKKSGAMGDRLKEAININGGLLALGNVISVLGGGGRILHVPYRDSKLTRLLQDSLGGNSRTLMIACASPCFSDYGETTNTLAYANRAKNIKNKIVVNQEKEAVEVESKKPKFSEELSDTREIIDCWYKEVDPILTNDLPEIRLFEPPPPVTLNGPDDVESIARLREYYTNRLSNIQEHKEAMQSKTTLFQTRLVQHLCVTDLQKTKLTEVERELEEERAKNRLLQLENKKLVRENRAIKQQNSKLEEERNKFFGRGLLEEQLNTVDQSAQEPVGSSKVANICQKFSKPDSKVKEFKYFGNKGPPHSRPPTSRCVQPCRRSRSVGQLHPVARMAEYFEKSKKPMAKNFQAQYRF